MPRTNVYNHKVSSTLEEALTIYASLACEYEDVILEKISILSGVTTYYIKYRFLIRKEGN